MSSQYIPNKPQLTVTKQNKEPRAIDIVQSEYMQAAVELGNIEYQIKTLEVQKGSCISRMSELSLESTLIKPNKEEPSNGEVNSAVSESSV